MKWLLVTTKNKNPGDEFIRIGVQSLIRSVDKDPSYILVDKENDEERKKLPAYDRAVWCGMPVFWSNGGNKCYTIKWWDYLLSIGKNKPPAMIVGAGSFCHWKDELNVSDPATLMIKAKEVVQNYHKVYARDPVVPIITGLDIDVEVCPAAFTVIPWLKKDLKLCNLMPLGAHYEEFGKEESLTWRKKVNWISDILKDNGFTFVAHSKQEGDFAKRLGWENVVTYRPGYPGNILAMYSRAKCYIGNRVHGAICSAAAGAEVISIGYDSRQEAVKLLTEEVYLPSEVNKDLVSWFASKKEYKGNFDLEAARKKQMTVFQEFGDL
jgi:hypothetical protein